jgi:hypothetical protein
LGLFSKSDPKWYILMKITPISWARDEYEMIERWTAW